jgi:hypothetical protein
MSKAETRLLCALLNLSIKQAKVLASLAESAATDDDPDAQDGTDAA